MLQGGPGGSVAAARDLTEDEEKVEDSIIEDKYDEATKITALSRLLRDGRKSSVTLVRRRYQKTIGRINYKRKKK